MNINSLESNFFDMTNPIISVLLPVYNAEHYIYESINSILKQTVTNFEFIIIDDCSTDNSLEIIKLFDDKRILVFKNEKNLGISETLNFGVSKAKGKYIARMDADDVACVDKFENQLKVFSENKKLVVCGTNAYVLGTSNVIKVPENHQDILEGFFVKNMIIHPTVMIRKDVFDQLKYEKEDEPAEDFSLWTKLILRGAFYNIQKPLLHYRIHQESISSIHKTYQKQKHATSIFNFFLSLNPSIPINTKKDFLEFSQTGKIESLSKLKSLVIIFLKLKKNKAGISLSKKITIQIALLIYEFIKQKIIIKNPKT